MTPIIAFTFAGGNKYSFTRLFSQIINVRVIEYPERVGGVNEKLITDINLLVDLLIPKLVKTISSYNEYIIYGHSMGGIVGYLICKKIEELNLKKPIRLVVSGSKSPKHIKVGKLSNLSNTNDFWKEVSKFGGIPEELNNYQELIEYFTPILKADFKCIENYKYDENAPKLTIPIDVFHGSEEDITLEQAEEWQDQTSANVNVTELQGNHFFIFDHKEYFTEYFKNLQLNATI